MEEKFLTKNGIEIYGYKNPNLHGFFISLYLRAGSMYESESESGITHFFEHIAIRNVNKQMGGALYSELDRRGVEFNASTQLEMVQFYVSGAQDKFDFGAKALTRILSPIILTPAEIDAERRRIKAEIREADDKSSLAYFTYGIVHKETSLARFITGTLSGVSKISAKRLEEYRKNIFAKENIFFYVTGNFTDDDINYLSKCIEEYDIPHACAVRENIAPISKYHFRRELEVYVKNAPFTSVRFTFDLDMSKLSVPVTDLIYDMLLSGYNSKLFIEMSEVRGLFYDITGGIERYRNIGEFYFAYELRGKDISEAIALTVDILNGFKKNLVNSSEMMKSGYVDNADMLYDDTREFNFTMAYDNHIMKLGYGALEERKATYASVTPQEVRAAACQIFTPENLTLTVKGNKKKINTEEIKKFILRLKN